jgi:nucleotide-binding universal stress UspA family protein
MTTSVNQASILVPIDFSEITTATLAHARMYAKITSGKLILCHFIPGKAGDNSPELTIESERAEALLLNYADQLMSEHGLDSSVVVRPGRFHEAIGALANELNVGFVVMGTKGIHGLQRWSGSNAIKVILNGKQVPFIVVQDLPKNDKPEHVVIPFSFEAESRQKLARVPNLAKLFECTFHVVSRPETDEFIKRGIDANVNYAKKYLEENKCRFDIGQTPGKKSFHKEVIDYADSKSADLILIMSEEDHEFLEFFSGNHEQEIIANDRKIPVMVLNPKDTMRLDGAPMFF